MENSARNVKEVGVFSTPVGRVRAVGMIEGVSFILLMFVAMPLKYLSPYPAMGKEVVFWVGLAHGLLFIAYAVVTFVAWGQGALRFKHVALAALASLLPFGPFVIDRKLKAVEEQREPDTVEARG
jgi:integral membrane protein